MSITLDHLHHLHKVKSISISITIRKHKQKEHKHKQKHKYKHKHKHKHKTRIVYNKRFNLEPWTLAYYTVPYLFIHSTPTIPFWLLLFTLLLIILFPLSSLLLNLHYSIYLPFISFTTLLIPLVNLILYSIHSYQSPYYTLQIFTSIHPFGTRIIILYTLTHLTSSTLYTHYTLISLYYSYQVLYQY